MADKACNERFTIRMQLVLSSSVIRNDGPILDGCFTEGRASCTVNLATGFVARLSGVVAAFVRVVLRVELAVFVGGIEVSRYGWQQRDTRRVESRDRRGVR